MLTALGRIPANGFDAMKKPVVPDSEQALMKGYDQYVEELSGLLNEEVNRDEQAISEALNGRAYEVLRELIPLNDRRISGAFFTQPSVSAQIAKLAKAKIEQGSSFIDPACGTGDLLIAAAKFLPIRKTYQETLEYWSSRIFGFDIHREFVEATRLRLALLARERGGFQVDSNSLNAAFLGIRKKDALSVEEDYREIPVVLLNPPYSRVPTPEGCSWTSGRVSSAALFVDHLSRFLPRGAHIFAVLPEVLRCGSSYESYRSELGKRAKIISEKSIGIFDRWTDVDVFVSEICLKDEEEIRAARKPADRSGALVVENWFTINVGPVVAFRSPKRGPVRDFLEAKDACPWRKDFICTRTRQFSGTVFDPPFVVIRRTSRPSDRLRAVGTIVRGNRPVAVENHLLVARPLCGTVKRCRELLSVLRRDETNEYLNSIMRCRHLTVGAVRNIPWNEDE